MSFKKFSSTLGTPNKGSPSDKRKEAPAGDEPATQPDKTPVEVTPTSKP